MQYCDSHKYCCTHTKQEADGNSITRCPEGGNVQTKVHTLPTRKKSDTAMPNPIRNCEHTRVLIQQVTDSVFERAHTHTTADLNSKTLVCVNYY